MTLIKWKEGAAVTVDFGQGFDGTVDQGHYATHHPGDSRSALLFELWDEGLSPTVRLQEENYADGQWHYFVARFDSSACAAPNAGLDGFDAASRDLASGSRSCAGN